MSKTLNTQFNPSLKFKVEFVISDLMQYIAPWEGKETKPRILVTVTAEAENYQSQNGLLMQFFKLPVPPPFVLKY